ncbi:hypothetical protein MBLNU230_g0897t1 [Neophaeotheca triangularis]
MSDHTTFYPIDISFNGDDDFGPSITLNFLRLGDLKAVYYSASPETQDGDPEWTQDDADADTAYEEDSDDTDDDDSDDDEEDEKKSK